MQQGQEHTSLDGKLEAVSIQRTLLDLLWSSWL